MKTFRMNRLAAVGAAAVALAAVASAPAAAAGPAGLRADATYVSYEDAVPGIAPPDADTTAIYLDSTGQPIIMDEVETTGEPTTAAWACTPESGRDNPHRSSTGVAVSGHGWWNQGTCSGTRANVYNCLYEWYTDNTWRQKACSATKELRPRDWGGGRTTARRDCDNTRLTSWRNHVDVNVIGEWDTSEWPYRAADVYCRVY